MKITTTRFGELEINPDAILTFPNGLPGLESCKRYQLLHEDLEDPVVFYLQSLDDPAVSFSIIDPAQFGFNYEIVLTDEEVELLQAGDPNELAVVLMVYKPLVPENQKIISHGGITANINGPLVLNPGKKLGMQKLLVGPRYDITLRGS